MFLTTLRPAAGLLLAALVLLPLTGCDETGGGASGDTAVQDAVIARQSGNFAAAETILRRELDRNPQSATVRAELATTILERERLTLLDIDRIARFITDTAGNPVATPASSAKGATCRYASEPGATPFDPTDLASFPDIQAGREAIAEALALIEPVLPASLRTFDVCLTLAPDGTLAYDHAAAAAQLRASGLTDAAIGQLLAVNALARFLDAYLFVTTEVPQQTAWYRLANGSIGVCADDEDALVDDTEEAVEQLGTALLSLDVRARAFVSGPSAGTLVATARDAVRDIRDGLADYCSR